MPATKRKATKRRPKAAPAAMLEPDGFTIAIPPLEDPGAGYRSEHLAVGLLSKPHREVLKRLTLALDSRGAWCSMPARGGRQVRTNADSIRWLLDRLAETMDDDGDSS